MSERNERIFLPRIIIGEIYTTFYTRVFSQNLSISLFHNENNPHHHRTHLASVQFDDQRNEREKKSKTEKKKLNLFAGINSIAVAYISTIILREFLCSPIVFLRSSDHFIHEISMKQKKVVERCAWRIYKGEVKTSLWREESRTDLKRVKKIFFSYIFYSNITH